MAMLDVFEMTNSELNKTLNTTKKVTESSSKARKRKAVKESVGRRFRSIKKVPANKIRLEAIGAFVEDDEEVSVDYTPEDDVMVVVDPEMDEAPDNVEDAKAEAEQHIGDHICQCSICGATYITDEDVVEEDLESEDAVCPVCGEEGEQIIVGEVAPMNTEEETEDDNTSEEDDFATEDDFDVEDEDQTEDTTDDTDTDDDVEDDTATEESFRRARRMGENQRRPGRPSRSGIQKPYVPKKMTESQFDEVTLNRMLTKFARENYDNIRAVKISRAKTNNGTLTLEGIVTTTKGNKRTVKFVCENYKPSSRMTLRFKEYGPFTESYRNNNNSFIVECTMKGNTIRPVALKYSYKVKENRSMYAVSGSVLKESLQKRPRG